MSLRTVSASLTRDARTRFPGAVEGHLRTYVELQFRTALNNPGRELKDEALRALAEEDFVKAVANDEEWAVALSNSLRDNVVKPLAAEARAKGLDPATIVAYKTGMSEAEALAMVESLDRAEAAHDEDSDGADPEAVTGL